MSRYSEIHPHTKRSPTTRSNALTYLLMPLEQACAWDMSLPYVRLYMFAVSATFSLPDLSAKLSCTRDMRAVACVLRSRTIMYQVVVTNDSSHCALSIITRIV